VEYEKPVNGIWLEVVSGPGARQRVEVGSGLLIGREGPEEGTLGGDPELSRRHARVSPFEGGERLLVEDLGSANGTFVNGERIAAPTVVGVDDTVGAGDSVLRVRAGRNAGAPPVGVHELPEELFGNLIARTPVPKEWIFSALLRAIPIVIAANFVIRAVAVEYFDVSPDIPAMEPHVLLGLSICPALGSTLFFWFDFGRRPRDRTILIYLIPGLIFSLAACAIELVAVPADGGTREYITTAIVAAVQPSIVMPTMVGLRTRARLRTEAELKRARQAG